MDKKFFDNTIIAQYAVTGVPLKVYVDSRYLTITDPDDVENPIIGHGMEPNGEMYPFSYPDIDHLLVADNIIDLETYNKAMADQFKSDEPAEEAPEGEEEAPEGEEPTAEEAPEEEVPEEEPTTEEGIKMNKLTLSEALPPHMDPSWGTLLTVSIPMIAKLLYDLGIKNKDDIKKFIEKLKDKSPKQESVYEVINGITEISRGELDAQMDSLKAEIEAGEAKKKAAKQKMADLKKQPIEESYINEENEKGKGMFAKIKSKVKDVGATVMGDLKSSEKVANTIKDAAKSVTKKTSKELGIPYYKTSLQAQKALMSLADEVGKRKGKISRDDYFTLAKEKGVDWLGKKLLNHSYDPQIERNESVNEGLDAQIRQHINTYSVSDDPYDVAVEIGKNFNWSDKQVEKAEAIIRKKYIKESVNEARFSYSGLMNDINKKQQDAMAARKAYMDYDGYSKTYKMGKKLDDLYAERSSIMQDMEQEAEPEGGPIADRYGKQLNDLDSKISKLEDAINTIGDRERELEKKYQDAMDALKQARLAMKSAMQKESKLNEFVGPMRGSGNRDYSTRDLVDRIGELDDILMYNSEAGGEWEDISQNYLDGEEGSEYWEDLSDQELQDAIDDAESLMKTYGIRESVNENVSAPYIYQVGDIVQNVNPTCPHYGSKGIVMSIEPDELTYSVTNSGDTFKPGMRLTKTLDQLAAL